VRHHAVTVVLALRVVRLEGRLLLGELRDVLGVSMRDALVLVTVADAVAIYEGVILLQV
jgi:hypothetical protein